MILSHARLPIPTLPHTLEWYHKMATKAIIIDGVARSPKGGIAIHYSSPPPADETSSSFTLIILSITTLMSCWFEPGSERVDYVNEDFGYRITCPDAWSFEEFSPETATDRVDVSPDIEQAG